MKNYSRQREAILEVLRSTDTHPTAAAVYERVRQKLPNISLGTVYRNLADLKKNGDILGISVGDGYEHFDGDVAPHIHLHCRCCGDIADLELQSDPAAEYSRQHGFTPENGVYVLYGVCSACNDKN